jgi:hypothetical protein
MKKFKGIIRLMRFELAFSAGICVVLGQMLAWKGIVVFNQIPLQYAEGDALPSESAGVSSFL